MSQLDGWTAVIADRWLLTLLHFLWQGTALALGHALLLHLVRPHTAAVRYLLSLATFVLLLAAPVATVLTIEPPPRPLPPQQSVTPSPASAGEWDALSDDALSVDPLQVADDWLGPAHESPYRFPARTTAPIPTVATELDDPSLASGRNHPLTELLYRWQPTLLTAWLAGVVLLGLRLLVSFVRTLRLIRDRQPVSAALAQRVDTIAHRMALRRTPRVFLSPRLREAIVTGYLRPLVLLPVAWATELPCEVLDAVIAHELAHIRRYDLWVILLQRLAETLLFYHPAVWWLSRSLSRERELCCDALAVQATGSAIDYAVALEHVAHRLRGLTPPARWNHILSPTLGGQKMELLNRVQHVLKMTDARPAPGRRRPMSFTPHMAAGPRSLAFIVVSIVLATTAWGYLATQTERDDFVEFEPAHPARGVDLAMAALVEAQTASTDDRQSSQASPAKETEPDPVGDSPAPPLVETTDVASAAAAPRRYRGQPVIDTADGPAIEYPIGEDVALYPATPGAPVAESPIAFAISAEELAAAATIEQLGGRIDLLYGVRTEAMAGGKNVRATILRNELVWNVHWEPAGEDVASEPPADKATPRLPSELVDALTTLQPRVALFLGPRSVTDDDLSRLSRVAQLRRVNLEGSQDVSGQVLEHLSRLPRLEALEWITPCTDADLAHLRGMISLTHLTLDASQLTDQGIASLTRMPHLQSLRSLGLVRCQPLTRACVQHIAALPNLKTLSLGGCALSPADLAPLKSLTLLEQFTFCPSMPRDARPAEATTAATVSDAHVTEFRHWPHLRMMTLSPCRLSRETLESLRDWGPRDQSAPDDAPDARPGSFRMLTLPQLYLNDCTIIEPDGREVHYDLVRLLPDRASNMPISNPVEAPLPPQLSITYEPVPRIEMSAADATTEQKAAKGTKTLEVRGGAIKLDGLLARDFRIRPDASTIETGLGKLTRGDFRCTFKTARISVASNRVRGSDEFPTIQRLQLTGGVATIAGEPEYGIQADELDIEFDKAGLRPLTIVARGQVNVWERQSSGVSNRVRADRMTLQLADGVPQASFSTEAALLSKLTIEGNSVLSDADVRAILQSPSAVAGTADSDRASHPIWDGLQRLRSRLTELGYPRSTCLLELRANDDGQQASLTITEGPTAQQLQPEIRIQGRIVLDGVTIEGTGMTLRPATNTPAPITADTPLPTADPAEEARRAALLETALQAWCQGFEGPVHYTFDRYTYNSTLLVEKRAEGEVWRESPTKWRIDARAVPTSKLPALTADGQRVNPHKPGPNGQPYRVESDVSTRWVRNGLVAAYADLAESTCEIWVAPGDWSPANSSPSSADGATSPWQQRILGSLFDGRQSPFPTLIGIPQDPDELRKRYTISLGPRHSAVRQDNTGSQLAHLIFTPHAPSTDESLGRFEVLLNLETRRCQALKMLDATGQQETVYAFRDGAPDAGKTSPQAISSALSTSSWMRTQSGREKLKVQYRAHQYAPLIPTGAGSPPGESAPLAQSTLQANDAVSSPTAPPEETGPAPKPSADIFRGLDERVDVEFLDTPLGDALRRLAQDHLGGRLTIDPDGLRTAGVSEQRPVNLVVSGISLRSALKLILQPLDLDWTVTDGSLVVTSRWQAREQLQTRVYPVADLVMRPSDNPQPRPVDPSILELLSELILSTVEPNAWSEQGGSGSIVAHPVTLSLVIRARPETHQQIADLLSGLRRLQVQTGVVEFAAVQATPGSTPARIETNLERTRRLADAAYEATLTAADRQIRDRLHEPCTLEVANEPLAKVLAALSTRQQVNIVVDNAGLAECGITADQPVTLRLHDVPLETALRVLLESHGLTHVIEDEVLKITSQLRAEGQPLVLYRCGGLLAGSPHPMPDLRRYADLIEMTISPDSWNGVGGSGSISVHESTSSLVVRQSPANHRQIAHLLGNLERVRSGGQPHLGPLPPQSEANRKVFEQLGRARLAPNFQSAPLQDVMRTLAEQFAVNLWLDPHGLTEADAAPTTPVTLSLAELPAHEALDRLLQPLGLAWCVEDGLIVVSSPRRCSGAPATQVYAVDWWLDAQADGQPARDLRTLAASIESEVCPDSWSTTGGWGRIQWDGRTRTLIVHHTLKQQRQVASYLADLRMQTEPAR